MIHFGLKMLMSSKSCWRRLTHPLTGLVLTLGLAIAGLPFGPAYGSELPQAQTHAQVTGVQNFKGTPTSSSSTFPADGVYLYGQAPEPGQIGVAYVVMEVRNGQTTGAFYMPNSSFDCFYGEVGNDQLNLTIINSYEQASYAYSVPIEQTAAIATVGGGASASAPQLVGYYPINSLSQIDHDMLATCRANQLSQI